jgi:hypothetical protein
MSDFFDLAPEERAAWYEKAREETGVENFFDLTPEERAEYYDRATAFEQNEEIEIHLRE